MLQGFTEPSNDDNILEVVAVLGASQMVRKLLFFVQLALFFKSYTSKVSAEMAQQELWDSPLSDNF